MDQVTPKSNEYWKRAYLGPLPKEFLRVSTPLEMQEVADRQAALALQHHQYTCAPQYSAANIAGRLSITVVQAKLVKNYGITRMDPYVRLRLGHYVYETQTAVNGSKNPRWNRVMHCQLPIGVDTIALEVYDECSFSMDELIGWTEIKIPATVLRGETHEDWYALSGKQGEDLEGTINLVLSYDNLPAIAAQSRVIRTTGPVMLTQNVSASAMPVFVAPVQPQLPVQQPPKVLSEEELVQIQEMFPAVDKEVIKSVAEVNRQDKDMVINALLQMTN